MNASVIQAIIDGSLSASLTFPKVIELLQKENVVSYHIDFLRHEARYYSANGESLVRPIAHETHAISQAFSAEKVQAAIRRSQAGQINYQQFIGEACAAGCVYYIVYLNGRNVVYLCRNGE